MEYVGVMRTTRKSLGAGEAVELGDVVESYIKSNGSRLNLIAVWEGEPEKYVVLTTRVGDDEELDVPEQAQVLAVTEGPGVSDPTAWLLVPSDAYGGSA